MLTWIIYFCVFVCICVCKCICMCLCVHMEAKDSLGVVLSETPHYLLFLMLFYLFAFSDRVSLC